MLGGGLVVLWGCLVCGTQHITRKVTKGSAIPKKYELSCLVAYRNSKNIILLCLVVYSDVIGPKRRLSHIPLEGIPCSYQESPFLIVLERLLPWLL